MQIEIMNLDVDGSLSNPFVLGAVAIWTLIMMTMVALAAWAWTAIQRHNQHAHRVRVAVAAGVAVLMIVTPIAQFLIANIIYRVNGLVRGGPLITSVGFYGGPPVWPAWVASSLAAGAMLYWMRRSRHGTPDVEVARGGPTRS